MFLSRYTLSVSLFAFSCALKRGQRSVMLMPAAVFSPNVCFPESCHTGLCVYDGGRLLNQRTCVAVTALMVFTHVYSVYTLPNTCRPTRAPPVKVRQWLSHLAHVINVRHRELSALSRISPRSLHIYVDVTYSV